MRNVAVLMSTYNGEKYLREQLDSILNQSGCNVSITIRDDGSKDYTINILNKYKYQNKLRWYDGPNLKSAHSFMDLVLNSEDADYYAFSDQDDIWDSDKLERAILYIDNIKEPCVYFSNTKLIDSDGKNLNLNGYKIVKNLDFYSLVCSGGIIGCTMVFNKVLRDILVNHPIPRNIIMHDYYVVLICLLEGGRLIYDAKPHVSYRQHEKNVIGIPIGFVNKVKNRLNYINCVQDISIASQSTDILELYKDEMPVEYKKFLHLVSEYRNNWFNTLRLAFNRKIHYSSLKSELFIRITLLLRKR